VSARAGAETREMSLASPVARKPNAAFRHRLPFALCGAAAAVLSLYVAPNIGGVFGALLAIVMTAIAHRDAHEFIIPDQYSAAAFALALAAAWLDPGQDAIWPIALALLRAAVLALAFLGIRFAYRRFRGRQGLGLGDVKLAAVAGAWLDWTMLPVAVEIAALAALTAIAVHQLMTRQALKLTARLPFGLFFAPAIWIAWVLQTVLPGP
jgi:leader peptidase (prepilin peptidase) / N-methyltransferase